MEYGKQRWMQNGWPQLRENTLPSPSVLLPTLYEYVEGLNSPPHIFKHFMDAAHFLSISPCPWLRPCWRWLNMLSPLNKLALAYGFHQIISLFFVLIKSPSDTNIMPFGLNGLIFEQNALFLSKRIHFTAWWGQSVTLSLNCLALAVKGLTEQCALFWMWSLFCCLFRCIPSIHCQYNCIQLRRFMMIYTQRWQNCERAIRDSIWVSPTASYQTV